MGTRSLSWKLTPHAPGLAQPPDGLDGIEWRADELAEGIPAAVAHGPQAERELVLGGWLESGGHRRRITNRHAIYELPSLTRR